MDSCIGRYRMFFESRKWYHRIFFHSVDEALCNAWLLYKRDFAACNEGTGKPLSLYQFKADISYVLRTQCQPLKRKPGRPSTAKRPALSPTTSANLKKRNTKVPRMEESQDPDGHIVVSLSSRGICAMKKCRSRSVFYCLRCKVHLCVLGKNCFALFHGVDLESAEIPNRANYK